MKGLKLTEIESHGFKLNFKRFYLTEHPVLPQVSMAPHHHNDFLGNYVWYEGELLEVFRSRKEAERTFGTLSKNYVVTDIDFA